MIVEVPLHVSGLWRPVWRRSAISTGSLGAGVLLKPGAVCSPGGPRPPVPTALGEVRCKLPVPVGKGFATSAAIALASAIFKYKSFVEAAARAHVAEVLNKTGLGDVMAIAYGRGVAVRTEAGGPGWGRVESLEVPRKVFVVGFTVKGLFADTPSMLSSLDVREAFEDAWKALLDGFDFYSFLEAAEAFSARVGFLKFVEPRLLKLPGVMGGYVKKSAGVLFVEGAYADEVLEEVKKVYKVARAFTPASFYMRVAP
ncbi:GHMP kinase [Ignicoccus hospitalis]|uniref:Pantoate kinase n=1 Tax=Ignicoccus hospitalis (strain KIN4/I / DSM 18386 / JCM 14125) TaxID=453591 RepID=A8A998_IGNH4|nr:GHMP kinase [Ignicoccus hospitalis]ABU81500.1 GHMP kinase [Ignicoccus hospitalis KIN4/I]HIH90434.1 GHMP kinase [Desulfurococcaceae archaeon]